jgi:glycine cleavage system H protein
MVGPPLPPLPPGPPGPPGSSPRYQPGLTDLAGNPNPEVVARLRGQQAMAQRTAAEAAEAVRRQRLAGRWYTPDHMWVAINGMTVTVGLTDYAAQQLGDIVYVSLPPTGVTVTTGDPCGQVESTKATSDLYAPVDGEVTEVNEELDVDPGMINTEPYGVGWMFRVRLAADANGEVALPPGLLPAAEYEQLAQ